MKKCKEKKLKISKRAKVKSIEGMSGCGKYNDTSCGINAKEG